MDAQVDWTAPYRSSSREGRFVWGLRRAKTGFWSTANVPLKSYSDNNRINVMCCDVTQSHLK
jgi:hypothetical protein